MFVFRLKMLTQTANNISINRYINTKTTYLISNTIGFSPRAPLCAWTHDAGYARIFGAGLLRCIMRVVVAGRFSAEKFGFLESVNVSLWSQSNVAEGFNATPHGKHKHPRLP